MGIFQSPDPGGETQIVLPTRLARLSHLVWIIGFHASSSVMVKSLLARMSLQVSFAATWEGVSFVGTHAQRKAGVFEPCGVCSYHQHIGWCPRRGSRTVDQYRYHLTSDSMRRYLLRQLTCRYRLQPRCIRCPDMVQMNWRCWWSTSVPHKKCMTRRQSFYLVGAGGKMTVPCGYAVGATLQDEASNVMEFSLTLRCPYVEFSRPAKYFSVQSSQASAVWLVIDGRHNE